MSLNLCREFGIQCTYIGWVQFILLTVCSMLDACSERVKEHDKILSSCLVDWTLKEGAWFNSWGLIMELLFGITASRLLAFVAKWWTLAWRSSRLPTSGLGTRLSCFWNPTRGVPILYFSVLSSSPFPLPIPLFLPPPLYPQWSADISQLSAN